MKLLQTVVVRKENILNQKNKQKTKNKKKTPQKTTTTKIPATLSYLNRRGMARSLQLVVEEMAVGTLIRKESGFFVSY